jgi:hypothetical protein
MPVLWPVSLFDLHSFVGYTQDGTIESVAASAPEESFFSLRAFGPLKGNYSNQNAPENCRNLPPVRPNFKPWAVGTTVYYQLDESGGAFNADQRGAIVNAFELWKAASLANDLGVIFEPWQGQEVSTRLSFKKGILANPDWRAEGTLSRAIGPPPTSTVFGSVVATSETDKLLSGPGYLKMTLHEIGHSMGLDDNHRRRGSSVMNQFSIDNSRRRELGGMRDDPLGDIATSVMPCDIAAVKRSRAR